jgi:membrane protein YdbS with pleckstrin-like domain
MTENTNETNDPRRDVTTPDADAGIPDQPDAPTTAPKEKLTAGVSKSTAPEEELWSGRTSWKHYAGRIAIADAISLLAIIAAALWGPEGSVKWVLLVVVLAGIVLGAQIAIMVLRTRYRVTSERLFIERGIVRQTIDQTELIRVDDVRVEKLLIDRLLGLGSIDVLSTDASDQSIRIEGVAGAEDVAEIIRAHMRAARRNSLFMETL